MAKKQKNPRTLSAVPFKKLAVLLLTLTVLGVGFASVQYVRYLKKASDTTSLTPIRELVLLAQEGLLKEAPIEPQTGDIYFPTNKLYLPANDSHNVYYYTHSTDDQNTLSITTSNDLASSKTQMYSATNIEELFDHIPKLQACSRGIRIYENKLQNTEAEELKLKTTVEAGNGRILYLYAEPTCDFTQETIDTLKKLRAY